MIEVLRAAADLQEFCRAEGWKYCCIGGLEVQHWAEPRLTRDVDMTLLTGFGGEEAFIEPLLRRYPGRISDAGRFARENRVLLLTGSGGIGLDIALGAIPFEESVVTRAREVEMAPGIVLRICSSEDLIVLKALAGRPLDWHDAEMTIVRQGADRLDWDYIESQLGPLAEVKGQPEIIDRLRGMRGRKG